MNVDGGWGVGIDGCTITKVAVRDAMISLDVRDDVHVSRALTTRFTGVSKPEYTLRVNGKVIGTYASRELGKGIDVAI